MAVSKMQKDTIVKDYSVTTATNSSVSPFGAYADLSTSAVSPPTGYTAVSATLLGIGSTNPAICRLYGNNGECFVYSKSAATFTCRVVYQ